MKKIVITLIVLSSFLNVLSGNNNLEGKDNIIENEEQYDKLIDLAKTYFKKNTEYSFNCAYKAHLIAEEQEDHKKNAECNMIMGDIFKENNSYPTAITYYKDAITNLNKIKDYHTIYKLYIKIAELYQNGEFDSKWCIEAMDNALEYANLINKTEVYNDLFLSFGKIYLLQKEYDLAENYYNKVLKNSVNRETIKDISTALTNKATIYIQKKEYEKALNIIDSSLYLCIRDFNDSLQVINYSYKAQIYDSINDYESAKKYYEQSSKLAYSINDYYNCGINMMNLAFLNQKNENYDEAIEVYQIIRDSTQKYKMYNICHMSYYQLAKCYASLGQYEKAYESFNKHDIYYDSSYRINQDKIINELQNSYLLSLNAKELKTMEIENENRRSNKKEWQVFISIIIMLVLTLITIIILYSKNRKMFHKNEITTYEQQLKIDKIENNLMEYQLKSNKELLVNLALHLKYYIEYINPLKDELKAAIELPEDEQKNKIKNIYISMQNNIKILNNTENLNKQINNIYKDFLDKLDKKYPGLTKSEKKLCSYLYTNMSSKEIATITNTTIRTIETSRYRLRKKLNLNRDEDIVIFLQNL